VRDGEPGAVGRFVATMRAAGRGDHDEARRQLARWSWGYWAIVALLVVATWDMTAKRGL
jgi:hypothetical protein